MFHDSPRRSYRVRSARRKGSARQPNATVDFEKSAVCRRCVGVGEEKWNEGDEDAFDGGDRRYGARGEGDLGDRVELNRKESSRGDLTGANVGAELMVRVMAMRSTAFVDLMGSMTRVIETIIGHSRHGTARFGAVKRIVKRAWLKAESLARGAEQEEYGPEKGGESLGRASNHDDWCLSENIYLPGKVRSDQHPLAHSNLPELRANVNYYCDSGTAFREAIGSHWNSCCSLRKCHSDEAFASGRCEECAGFPAGHDRLIRIG